MPSNPYQPPNAEVADAPQTLPPRPRAVRLACQLVLSSFLLGLVTLLPGVDVPRPEDEAIPAVFFIVVVAIFGAITVWLVHTTYQGRNWARWALLAYLILGWFLAAGELSSDFERSPLVGSLNVAVAVMELAAASLLFAGAGAKWFASGRPTEA